LKRGSNPLKEKGDNMKHIVMYSGGAGSYILSKRVIAKYGKENTILLFADTK
jgi:PP-loop superfamily ATP-utilizing enzyme